jgi:hypothetical protein
MASLKKGQASRQAAKGAKIFKLHMHKIKFMLYRIQEYHLKLGLSLRSWRLCVSFVVLSGEPEMIWAPCEIRSSRSYTRRLFRSSLRHVPQFGDVFLHRLRLCLQFL